MQADAINRWITREDVALKTVSYAQNHEDILLRRAFGAGHAGFYVDAGANDPVFHSVTKLLYENGWRGINIEPTPVLHDRLVADRPRDINLNVGVSDVEGTLTFFEVAPPLHGWSTFLPEIAETYRQQGVIPTERPIPVTTLNILFERPRRPGRRRPQDRRRMLRASGSLRARLDAVAAPGRPDRGDLARGLGTSPVGR